MVGIQVSFSDGPFLARTVSFGEGRHNCHIIHPLHVFNVLRGFLKNVRNLGKNSESNLSNKENTVGPSKLPFSEDLVTENCWQTDPSA